MAKINVISYDDYVGKSSSSSSNSTKTSGNVISYDDYIGKSPLQSPKQQVENQAKQNYESATKAYNSVLDAKKSIVKNEYNKLGNQAPQSQLKFSTTPSSTFVKNADGTTTIKSQYEKNQEAIQENQKKQNQLINNIKNNTDYQALTALETPLNNQRLLAKYNYDVAKEDNRTPTLLDKTLGVPYRAALDFFNVDKLTTNSAYVDENNNKMYLPADYQIRQENVRNSYGDNLLGKAARFGTDLGYNLTKIGLSSAINTLTGGFAPVGSMLYFEDMGIDSFNQAKLDGYDDASAALYGAINVASEMVTEKFLGGISKHLKLTQGDSALSSGLNKALSKIMKNDKLRSVLSNAFSEGTEEFVQEFIENYNKKLVLEKKSLGQATEETLLNSDVWGDALYSTLLGMASGGALAGISSPAIDTNNTGVIPDVDKSGNIDIKTYISQLNKAKDNTSNQTKIDNINQTLNYLKLNEALGNDTVNAQTMNQSIESLKPALDQVSDILPNETNINNEVNTNVETNVNDNINTNNIENGLYDDTQVYRNFGKALENDTLPGNGNEVVLPKASDNVSQTTNNVGSEQRLQVAPTSNVKVNNLYNSASQYLNNSEESLNLVNTMAKVVKDKGYNILFSDEGMNTKNGIINGKIETKNGETTITLNPYSPRAYEFVLVHEITHAIETNSLKSMIMDYAQKNSEFNAALDSLKKIYKTNEITSEVAADISGQLLGNQEFINQLSMTKPNLFMHIYNEIKALYHKLRGWKSENEFLEDLMNKWEYAYAKKGNNATNKVQNSIQENQTIQGLESYTPNEIKNITADYIKNRLAENGIYDIDIKDIEIHGSRGRGTATENSDLDIVVQYDGNIREDSFFDVLNNNGEDNLYIDGIRVDINPIQEDMNSYMQRSNAYDNEKLNLANSKGELDNSSFSLKQKQNDIIQENNPINPELGEHTWINSADDIKTYQEALQYDEYDNQNLTPDFTSKMVEEALKTGEITVYSSYDIKQGTFVTPSKMEAQSYAGDGKVYSKKVSLQDVAWIDSLQGQYAKVQNNAISKVDNQGRTLTKQQQNYFKDSKVRDDNGNLLEVYHGTSKDFNIFDKSKAGDNGTYYSQGFYFTTDKNTANDWAGDNGRVVSAYVNITNPYMASQDIINSDGSVTFAPSFYQDFENRFASDLPDNWKYLRGKQKGQAATEILQKNGYDGVIHGDNYIAFESNQIKNVDNTNPTTNNDIRYSKQNQNWQDYIEDNYKSQGTKTTSKVDNEAENYAKEKGYTFRDNGNLVVSNLTNQQINELVKIYKTTGYDDVSSDYLRARLKDGEMPLMREVADRFIEKELGYKPKYDTTKITQDADGNKLTKAQIEFYKDSDVRDIRGRLIPVYHRTNAEFTEFDSKAGKQHGNKYGKGFYFSITPENYGNNTMQVYLNAKEGEFKYIPSKGYYIVQNANQIKNVTNTNPTSTSNDIRYSKNAAEWQSYLEENYKTKGKVTLNKDNDNRTLSKQQQDYFKDSKIRDNNGHLITVYHTTTGETAQFNEFNPVGTQYYRFGDDVVNYYTNSKNMSGSYASQDYKQADTKKLTSIKDVNEYLRVNTLQTDNRFAIKENNGKYQLFEEKAIAKDAKNFISKLSENEMQQMRDNIYYDEKMAGTPYEKVFSWDRFDKELQTKFNAALDKYMGTADLVDMQIEMMRYLDNPQAMITSTANAFNGEVIKTYNTKEEMLKNIKTDVEKSNWSKNSKIQYEGYLDIKNPYVIDAEERNWNQVVQQSNDFIDELESRVPQDVKDNLSRLYQESANKSAEARESYNAYQKIIEDLDNERLTLPNIDDDIRKMNSVIKRVGIDEITLISEGSNAGIGVNAWYALADVLKQEGVIGDATASFIIDEFRVPNNVREWISKNLNKEINYKGVKNLKQLYENNREAYDTFDKYRLPQDYFIERISTQDDPVDLGNDLNDMFEQRAEIMGADAVGEEIAQAASVNFSKPELIRLWGTSKTTNDIVKEVLASNKDGKTNYDGVVIRNVYDYGGRSNGETTANDVYVTFNSNQFKAYDNTSPTNDADIRYSKNNKTWQQYLEENYVSRGTRTFGKDVLYKDNTQNKASDTYSIKNVLDTTQDTTTNTPITKGNDVLRAENNIDNSNLTKAEINELNTLEAVYEGGFSTAQEEARLEYLKNKRDGLIKYAELKQKVEFKDISKEYTKYKNDLGNFDPTLLNEAESNVKGYRNTKTKAQWLDIAEQIGANFKGNGQELTNYALQSWFEAQPNNKKSLNREGKGYVKFSVDEWVNAVYKGAGVGDKVTRTSTAPAVKTTKVENDYNTYTQAEINNMFQFSDDDGHKIALPDDVGERLATKTTLTPIEVGNLQNIIDSAYQINVNGNSLEIVGDYDNNIYTVKATKQGDTFVIDDMVKGTKNPLGSVANIETTTNDEVESIDNKKSKMENGQTIGEVINNIREQATKPTNQRTEYEETVEKGTNLKESSFYKNATETSQFITEDNRTKLSEVGDLKYYEGITNEDSLNKASKRLKDYGTNEAVRWMQQDNKTSSATDVAEGWILLKNYQDAGDYDSMVAVAKKMRQMGTIAGQTIQAYNIMARLTPEGMVKYAQSELSEAFDIYAKNKSKTWLDKNASKFDLNTQEVEFIVDTMKQVESMEDGRAKNIKLGEINKMLTEKLPPERGSGIKAWMRISMLFNPKTQIRNVMGNAVITPVNMVGDYFASVADKFIARKTGVRTTGTTDIKSYVKGFKKGLYESYDDFKRGINTRNIDANRFELGQAKSFNQNNTLGKALNKVDAINSFLLDAGDRGFYEASFTNSINNQLALNNTTKVTQDMIDIATSEALSRTWQDNNNYTKFVLSTRNMLNKVNVKGYGLGDVLIPFAKTPANLTKAIVDYSPAGLVNTIIQAKNLKNNISTGMNTAQQQHQFVQTLGKATAGTLLYVAAYGLAKAGIATGKSDDDKDTRDFLKNTLGVSSYSIKIGNKSFTYDWAQPVAAPLSIMTNIVNSKNNKGQALLEAVTSSLDSAGSILLEQSFVKSINEVLTDNDGIVSGLENAILDLPARAIPTFSKQIVDMTDSTQRQTFEYGQPLKTAVNKLKAKIPGVSYTLAPSVDSLGREIQKYGGKNNIFNVFLNPANVNTSNISDAAKEIYNVYKETGDNTIMPRVAPYYINSKGEKTILNTEQRKDFQKIAGNIIENSVNELKKNSNYKEMNYEDKSTTIKNIIDYAYNKARKDVLGMDMSNTYNKVNEWLDKGGKISDYYANKEEVNYSLQNPTKYNAIKGMSIDYNDYKVYQAKVNEIKNKYSGTKNANLRKQKVAEYINSLNLSANKKIMLFKMLGNYSIKNYSGTIKNYINNFDLTSSEKQEIYNSLF